MRRLVIIGLALLAAVMLSGCTGGGGASSVVDQAIAWISGLVTKSRGEPISSATVTLEESGQQATTDGNGRFQVGTQYRGNGTLRAEASGYLTLEWPVSVTSSGISNLELRLVTMADYDANLFRTLTGASNSSGTWRWNQSLISYYVDRSAPYQSQFDAPLQEAFTQWSMLTRRTITYAEGNASAPLQIRFVSTNPCGFPDAAGCAGVTSVGPGGDVQGAIIELHAGYATDVGLAIHELGHTLAFTGHSPTPTDVMYFQMNGATSPSNAEATVAAVLYSNPPGTTAPNIQLPAAQVPAVSMLVPVSPARAAAVPSPSPFPAFGAIGAIADMIRSWFGASCWLPLPGFCPPGL